METEIVRQTSKDGGGARRLLLPRSGIVVAIAGAVGLIGVPLLLGWLLLHGVRSAGFGQLWEVAILVAVNAAIFGAAIWWIGRWLARTEAAQRAEAASAEAVLRAGQETLRLTLDAARIGSWDLDLGTNLASHSMQHDLIFGYDTPVPKWSYETFLSHVLPADRERVQRLFRAGVASKTEWDVECRIFRCDDVVRWIWIHGAVVLNPAGEAVRMLGMVSDITERKRMEEDLRREQERFAATAANSPGVLYSLRVRADGQRSFSYAAPGIEHIFGVSPQELLTDAAPAFERIVPEDREAIVRAIAESARTLSPLRQEWRVQHPARGEIWVEGYSTPVAGSDGAIVWHGVMSDITERKNTELALRDNTARLHAADRQLADIVHGMTEACFALDADWRFTFINDRSEMLFRDRRETMLGRTIWDVFPQVRGTPMEEHYRSVMSQRTPLSFETFSAFAERWLDVRIFPCGDGVAAFVLDIHARKQAEASQRQSYQQLQQFIRQCPLDVAMFDREMRYVAASEAWAAHYGTDYESLMGQSHYEKFPTTPERWKAVHARCLAGAIERCEADAYERRPGLGVRWLRWEVRPWLAAQGGIGGILVTSEDITERKGAEQAIQDLNASLEQRVEDRTAELELANRELEAFSYSISHDLRAPLRAVDGFSRAVLEDYGPELPAEGQRYLRTICHGAQRMGLLIDDLLTFSRLSRLPLNMTAVDTNELVREILLDLRAQQNGREIEIRSGMLPWCWGDPALLRQVWVNLLSNALKYTRRREDATVEIGCNLEGGGSVFFVNDNGAGFDMRYAGKLFGVFQRLHRAEDYEGTGVGLAIVQRIVQRHGGRVWAEAEVDRGATFYFTLQERPVR